MKTVYLSVAIFLIILCFILFNSFFVCNKSDELVLELKNAEKLSSSEEKAEYERIYKKYKSTEILFSLTISHDELATIDECFSELAAAAESKNPDEIKQIKSRLTSRLEHINRLSKINAFSIF